MANQITIDIGAAANDGTGDPLRTAFNYVNNNFSNVWNTGLPNSNVQFLDNRILTVNTNANLVLAPNGIGKVASNVDIVPNTANVFALGGLTRRWNTIYGQYLDLSHNATIGGNLTVTGNLSAGNISYTSNVFVGDLEGSVFDGASSIVLDVIDSAIYVDNYRYANGSPVSFGGTPGGSNTQIQFNNAGSFGGSAAFTFDRTSNVLAISGNISAGNVDVLNLTTTDTIYGTTGTFSGDNNTGDGALYIGSPTFTSLGTDVMAQFTGNVTNYGQINFQNYSNSPTASGDYIATADNGNDTTHYIDMGITSSTWNGTQTNVLSGLTPNNGYLYVQDGNLTLGTRAGNVSYSWKFDTTGNLTVAGNVIPTGNNTQSLGSPTQQWSDLYVSNATIFMNNVPLSLNSSNVLTVNGADVVTTAANGESSIGNLNIVGTVVEIAAGAPDTLINITPSGPVAGWAYLQLPTNDTANTADTRLHNDAGNIEFGTGDFSTGSTSYTWTFDNTGNLSVPRDINFNGGSIVQVPDEDFHIRAQDAENDGWGLYLEVDDGANNVESRVRLERDSIQVGVGLTTGPARYWSFDNSGRLNLAGDIWGDYSGNLSILARGVTDSSLVEIATQDSSDIKRSNVTVTRDNITVTTSSGAYNWIFDVNGDLILPGGNTAIYTANAVGNVAGNSISITGGAADQTAYYATPGGNINLTGGLGAFNDGGGGGQGGSVNISSGLSADPAGVAGNVNIDTGDYTWTYGYNGELWVPGGTGYISSAANTITMYSDADELNGMLFYNGGVDIYAVDQVAIFANNAGSTKETRFLGDGTISVQGMIYPANGLSNVDIGNSTNSFGNGYFNGNISGNTAGYAIGYRDIPQVALSANATAALTDAGKHFYSTTAGNLQITIPDNANVAYPTGAALTVVVNAAGNVLIAQGTGVSLYMAGSSATGNRTVGAYGLATVMKVATDTWVISGTGVY